MVLVGFIIKYKINKIMLMYEILLKYNTDKNQGVLYPTESVGHTYGKSYDKIFESFNKTDKLNILEIGIQKGGSLLAWKEYFSNSNIYGVDIVDCIYPEYKNDNFCYIFDDIKSDKTTQILKDIKFDIIIDDGSHELNDVLFVVSNYLQKINDNGVLIIEDCQQPEYWIEEIKKLINNDYIIVTSDLRNDRTNYQYDNFLIIIKKK